MPLADFGGKPAVAAGTIIMWAGSLGSIPAGWVLCDGANGTPNMLDRFPRGVPDSLTDPGSTGGEQSKTISSAQMAAHTHSGSVTDADGSHSHTFDVSDNTLDKGSHSNRGVRNGGGSATSTLNGGHTHTASASNQTGSGSSYDNRPAYMEIAFLMKT